MRIGVLTRNLLATGLVSCSSLTSLSASALMMGEIHVHSHLGQTFRATIPLHPGDGEALDDRCFSLIRPERQDQGPYLSQANLSLDQKNDQFRLNIRSAQAINEPFVQLRIQTDCGQGRYEREFVVLLDPEERTAVEPARVVREVIALAPPVRVEAEKPRRAHMATPAGSPKPAAAVTRRTVPASAEPVARPAVSEPSVPARADETGEFRLKLSTGELDLSMLGKLSEEERQHLREKQHLLDADDQVANALSMKNRIMQLEEQLDLMQAEMAKTTSRIQSMSEKRGSVPAPVPETRPSLPEQGNWLLGDVSFRSMAGVGLILALIASVWWRWRRRETEARLDTELNQEFPTHESAVVPGRLHGEQTVAAPVPKPAPTPAQVEEDDFYHAATSIFDTGNDDVTFTEAESVLDEADLYLAYGWANRAIELLQEYLEKHPDDQQLWKKLFEVYSSQGMKQEFEQLALRCQATVDDNSLWVHVQKLGRELDEGNPLYLSSSEQELSSPAETEPVAVKHEEVKPAATDNPAAPLEFVLDNQAGEKTPEEPVLEDEVLNLDPLFPDLTENTRPMPMRAGPDKKSS